MVLFAKCSCGTTGLEGVKLSSLLNLNSREEFTLPMVTLEGKGKINEGILCGSVRCHVGHLFFFKLFIFSNLLGLGTEEQGVATWFIGPRTINMTSCTK